MEQNLKRVLLLVCISLSFVLAVVLTMLGYMAPALRISFATYQFFLIGVCVGALTMATIALIVEREQWAYYNTYFTIVMVSVFLLTVINCVVFRILGGEQFIRRLVSEVWVLFNIG